MRPFLVGSALRNGRQGHLSGDASFPVADRAAGGEGWLFLGFPATAFSREAISTYLARSACGHLLKAMRQGGDFRSLSDNETCTLHSGGTGGSGSRLVTGSPAMGLAGGTKNFAVRLPTSFFFLRSVEVLMR